MAELNRVLQKGTLPNGETFTVVDDPQVKEVYNDGVYSMQVGAAVTRIFMFKVAETPELEGPSQNANRQKSCVIVLPTNTFVEWILSSVDRLPSIASALSEMQVQTSALVDQSKKVSRTI